MAVPRHILFAFLLSLLCGSAAARVVIDMAAREVAVPARVARTATMGAGPVIDAFLAALGAGGSLVNGMPISARGNRADCCRYLPRVIPGILELPSVENAAFNVNRELLLALRPDVVLMHNDAAVDSIRAAGLTPFVLRLTRDREANAVDVMQALGRLYGREDRAQAFARHFDGLLRRVAARVPARGDTRRVRAIYFNHRALTLTSMTADWWIEAAGGKSVTDAIPLPGGRATVSIEQLLAWDPEVIFAATPEETRSILDDPRLVGVAAVRSRRVHPVPRSVIRWAHPTPEQAIGVLWAAEKLYPQHFADADVDGELKHFYRDFYGVTLTDGDLDDILHRHVVEVSQ